MGSKRPSVDVGGDPREIPRPAAAGHPRSVRKAAQATTRPGDPEARADAIGRAAPFSAWPRDVLLRLGAAASVNGHPSGAALIVNGRRCDTITVPVAGAVIASVSNPGGRRVVFKLDDAPYAYGLAALVDGLPLPHDLLADGPVTVVRIPHAAIRAELKHLPSLWESIAAEVNRRGRSVNMQMQQFVFDAPQVRAASLLLGMLVRSGSDGENGPAAIDLRLPQERMAELLGTSRQWVTAVVRELTRAGLVQWRYGRVTVLDVQALRRLASRGIDAAGQRSEHLAGQWHVDPAKAPAAGARHRAK
jgi:CRP-like cAMP-binding protein